MSDRSSKAWFAPKQSGYGTGLPIAWQGWAVLVVFFVAVGIVLAELTGPIRFVALAAIVAVFALVCSVKTEGGWRWRRGDRR
ncbi:MAG: hypothetical protein ACREEL_06655 [Stellaceae bacterium]